METVYDSLCSAGHTIEGLRGSSTAVMVGLMGDDWTGLVYRDLEALPKYTATGVSRSVMSNRLSYCFDWHGPSMTIDTACSSSMVAVHLAIQSLRNGESDIAVAAGANLLLSPGKCPGGMNLGVNLADGFDYPFLQPCMLPRATYKCCPQTGEAGCGIRVPMAMLVEKALPLLS